MSLILYHGARSGCAELVLESGLKPSWDGFTYLAYERAAIYAAYRSNHTKAPIFKVRVEEETLYPDPDYMAIFHLDASIEAQTKSKHLWKESLERYGQVAVLGGIAKENVLAVKEVNFKRWEKRIMKELPGAQSWIHTHGGERMVDWDAQKRLCAVSRQIMEMAFKGDFSGSDGGADTNNRSSD